MLKHEQHMFMAHKFYFIYVNLFQRYRRDDEESNSDDDYVPYVPVRERKKQELLKLGRLAKVTT